MRNWDLGVLRYADGNGALIDHVAIAAHRHFSGTGIRALILDPIGDGLRLTDDAEARCGNERDAAVAFVLMSGNQRMDRRGEAERGGATRYVMDAAIGNHDHAGDAVDRHVGKRRAQGREQARAVGLAVRLACFHHAHFKAGNVVQPVDHRSARGFGLLGAVAEILARTLVDDHDSNRVQRIAVLASERRVGEREHDQSERQRPDRGAAAA